MVDRPARNYLANTIRSYMDEKIMAFAFDKKINELRSNDETVNFVVGRLWYCYDDIDDHLANLSKPGWDYFQRLILLLESDAEIEYIRQRNWSVRQVIAGACVVSFGLWFLHFGIDGRLFAFAFLLGPVSILLSYWQDRSTGQQPDDEWLHLTPFSSFSELRAVRKATDGFVKKKYPTGTQKVRSLWERIANWEVPTVVLWGLWSVSLISPLVLLFQMLPEREVQTRIRLRVE